MFSIFAARMFERQDLQAHREQVLAQERQLKPLRELEDEGEAKKGAEDDDGGEEDNDGDSEEDDNDSDDEQGEEEEGVSRSAQPIFH